MPKFGVQFFELITYTQLIMNTQPVLDLPTSTAEVWLDVTACLFVAMSLALATGYYSDLPEQIPTHFDASGEADSLRVIFI